MTTANSQRTIDQQDETIAQLRADLAAAREACARKDAALREAKRRWAEETSAETKAAQGRADALDAKLFRLANVTRRLLRNARALVAIERDSICGLVGYTNVACVESNMLDVDAVLAEAAPAAGDDFHAFAEQQAEWSRAAFGPDSVRGPLGGLKHLAKEVQEALSAPDDIEEYVDCLFLVLDASRRAGFDSRRLLAAAFTKLEKNKARVWPDWHTLPLDQAIEHVRTAPPAAPEPERRSVRRDIASELDAMLKESGLRLCFCNECKHQATYGPCPHCWCGNPRRDPAPEPQRE